MRINSVIPLRDQSRALAVSVADTDDVHVVHDSIKAVRGNRIALTKHHPPLLCGVGARFCSHRYLVSTKRDGAIAEYRDKKRALEALRDDPARAAVKVIARRPVAPRR